MHLIVIIALGIFGGLWLFVKWGEWREARWVRKIERQYQRAERHAELERSTAENDAKLAREAAERQAARAAHAPIIKSGPWVGFAVLGGALLFLVALTL